MVTSKSPAWFDLMLLLLAGVGGSIDVISYFGLGHVFTANMTGNTILLGLSIGQGKLSSSLRSLAALAGFITGALLGALVVENKEKGWSFYVTLSLTIEGIIIAVFAILIYHHTEMHNTATLYISILLSAIAMGMQSATIRHLDIPGVVTTFITGTLTSIGMSAVKGLRQGFKKRLKDAVSSLPAVKKLEQRIKLQVVIFLTYGLAAVITGWIEYHGAAYLPFLPAVLIACVIGIAIMQPGNNISADKS